MTLKKLLLEALIKLPGETLAAFFPARYPQARMWRKLLGLDQSYVFKKQTFSSLLWRLEKEGLITKSGPRRKTAWRATDAGKRYVRECEIPQKAGESKNDGVTRVVSFDIPEPERKKRRWLRELLLELDYSPIQKSVWIGFSPLPADFLEELDLMHLRDCIHIFSVTMPGTLSEE